MLISYPEISPLKNPSRGLGTRMWLWKAAQKCIYKLIFIIDCMVFQPLDTCEHLWQKPNGVTIPHLWEYWQMTYFLHVLHSTIIYFFWVHTISLRLVTPIIRGVTGDHPPNMWRSLLAGYYWLWFGYNNIISITTLLWGLLFCMCFTFLNPICMLKRNWIIGILDPEHTYKCNQSVYVY